MEILTHRGYHRQEAVGIAPRDRQQPKHDGMSVISPAHDVSHRTLPHEKHRTGIIIVLNKGVQERELSSDLSRWGRGNDAQNASRRRCPVYLLCKGPLAEGH
jgi:hypothetical protein